ncbi:MAG: carboxypeptidase M32 [Pseudomonadales bacterium]|nr:carboxypeptidase M32 [Pseudomonadales bacterium]
MSEHYQALLEKLKAITDVEKAVAVLDWDRETYMPEHGIAGRTRQISTLSEIAHRMFTSNELGDLLAAAENEQREAAYDSDEASMLRSVRREYDEQGLFTPEFVRRRSEVTGAAGAAWAACRKKNDFAGFRPHLEASVAIAQEAADIYGYDDEKYDALLDKYERGMKTAAVRRIFDEVKAQTVPLIQAINERKGAIDDRMLAQDFPVEAQRTMCRYAAESVGYDFSRGNLAEVHHPFSTSFGRNDVRITTRFAPEYAVSSLFATLHESGHAMYEQGIAEALDGTPIGKGTSSGIHESQSRLFENQVGRSLGYWQAHFEVLQRHFPEQLKGVSVEQFYRAINKVQPSLIRVEADELTYNMHIILRFELEQALINGDLKVADLPGAWREKMQTLLGVVPETDSKGVLQDIHWSMAAFGYFPTYTLGNLYSAQFMAAARQQDARIEAGLAQGKTTQLLAWLRENVHRHGSKYDAPELCRRATGQTLSAEPFVHYVREKFGALYAL